MTEYKGRCFQNAHDFVCQAGRTGGSIVLVNGYVTGQEKSRHFGQQFGHAWVEIDRRLVYDTESQICVPLPIYYELGKINQSECFYYTFEEIVAKVTEIAANDLDADVYLPMELEPSPYELSCGTPPNPNNVRLNK